MACKLKHIVRLVPCLLVAACASGGQIDALPQAARVQPKISPYWGLERCVGDVINKAYPAPLLEIVVLDIKDRTTQPSNLVLGNGGADWAKAVLVKMGNKIRVPVVVGGAMTPQGDQRAILLLEGAYTGYDRVVKSTAAAGKMKFGGVELRLAGDGSFDLISGDFFWRRAGSPHVQGVISLVVAVRTKSGEGDVYVQDDKNGGAASFRVQSIQGIHQSQRAMVEFATTAMLAQATGVSLGDCESQSFPSLLQETSAAFKRMSQSQRFIAAQQLLKALGYYAGAVDGQWGNGSRSALNRFLLARSFPPASDLAAEHYVNLVIAQKGGKGRG